MPNNSHMLTISRKDLYNKIYSNTTYNQLKVKNDIGAVEQQKSILTLLDYIIDSYTKEVENNE